MSDTEKDASHHRAIPLNVFVGLSAVCFITNLCFGILMPILPNVGKSMGASGAVVGLIFAGYAIATGIFSPIFGRISDQYGRKKIILAGLCMYLILSFAYTKMDSLLMLGILWFLQGFASVWINPIAQSYIGDLTPKGREGRLMNMFYIALFGGTAIGPFLGGYLAEKFSINAAFYTMLAVSLIAITILVFVVPEESGLKNKSNKQKIGIIKAFKKVFRDRKMKGVIIYVIGRGFYRRGFNVFFPIYAVTVASLSDSQIGLVLSSYMIAGAFLQYPFGWLADRFINHRAELIAFGGIIASLTMFIIPHYTLVGALLILVAIKGIFSTFSRAPVIAVRTERGRYHGMGAVTGVAVTGMSIGQALGPIGFGAFADLFNISAAFYVGAIVGLLTTGISYWYLKSRKKSVLR